MASKKTSKPLRLESGRMKTVHPLKFVPWPSQTGPVLEPQGREAVSIKHLSRPETCVDRPSSSGYCARCFLQPVHEDNRNRRNVSSEMARDCNDFRLACQGAQRRRNFASRCKVKDSFEGLRTYYQSKSFLEGLCFTSQEPFTVTC